MTELQVGQRNCASDGADVDGAALANGGAANPLLLAAAAPLSSIEPRSASSPAAEGLTRQCEARRQ